MLHAMLLRSSGIFGSSWVNPQCFTISGSQASFDSNALRPVLQDYGCSKLLLQVVDSNINTTINRAVHRPRDTLFVQELVDILIHVGISGILLETLHEPTSLLRLLPLLRLLALLVLLEVLLIALLVAVLEVALVVVHVAALVAALVSTLVTEELFSFSDDIVHCAGWYLWFVKS